MWFLSVFSMSAFLDLVVVITSTRPKSLLVSALIGVVIGGAALLLTGCSSAPSIDREAAIAEQHQQLAGIEKRTSPQKSPARRVRPVVRCGAKSETWPVLPAVYCPEDNNGRLAALYPTQGMIENQKRRKKQIAEFNKCERSGRSSEECWSVLDLKLWYSFEEIINGKHYR